MFTGYHIGNLDSVTICHLQFADNTLLFESKRWMNVRIFCAILYLFEAMSGLKVNFHKSLLVCVNVNDSWLTEAASVLNCKIEKLPFVYLGLPIGGNMRRVLFYELVLNRNCLGGVAEIYC